MRIGVLFASATACIVTLSTAASAQAAAEGALTHALSSGVGSAIGKTLGNATNQLSGKIGQQVSNTVPRQRAGSVKTVRQRTKTSPAAPAATANGEAPSGSLIASIQGAEPQAQSCSPADKTSQSADAQAVVSKSPAQSGCSAKDINAVDAHPSVINLPAAK